MERLTLVLSVPAALSVAVMVSGKVPAAVGVPLKTNVPLPLCVAVIPAGSPVVPALVSGRAEPINRMAEYAFPTIPGCSCGVTNCGAAKAAKLVSMPTSAKTDLKSCWMLCVRVLMGNPFDVNVVAVSIA